MPTEVKPPDARELVARFLASIQGRNANAIAPEIGISHSQISRWRRGQVSKRLNPQTEEALRLWLDRPVSLPRARAELAALQMTPVHARKRAW